MAKIIARFDTKKVNNALDPEGGFSLQLKDRPIYDDTQVFEEVVKEKTLPFDKDMLEFAFLSVLKTMALKVSRDCNPRRIGNYIKFAPTLRGKVKTPYSAYSRDTCSSAIVVSSLSGLEKAIDENYVQFVNSREGIKVVIQRINWVGSENDFEIRRGSQIIATGSNMQYLPGDTVTFRWKTAAGADASLAVVPVESDVSHMLFDWPSALDALAEGSEVTIEFVTRGGVADAPGITNTKKVKVVVDGESKPKVKVTQFRVQIPGGEGTSADVQIFGENFAGVDGYSHNEGEPEFMNAKFYVNGSEDGNEMMLEDGRTVLHGVNIGDTVKVVLDVTSPDYDPTPAEATATVAG